VIQREDILEALRQDGPPSWTRESSGAYPAAAMPTPQLLIDHRDDLQLDDDWSDEAIVAAAPVLIRTLAKVIETARRDGDREVLERFAWFVDARRAAAH